jgi:2'-5' RNA ligase
MTTVRSFIAIELSADAEVALMALQNHLKAKMPTHSVRWVDSQSIHLTLHFLGDISLQTVEKVKTDLSTCAARHSPFVLSLKGLGCFPNLRRPRVVWVGVVGATTALLNLHQTLGQLLTHSIAYQPETRPYAPHLTLGRVQKNIASRNLRQVGQILEQEQGKVGVLATLEVTAIHLIKSELTSTKPIYTSLADGVLSPP